MTTCNANGIIRHVLMPASRDREADSCHLGQILRTRPAVNPEEEVSPRKEIEVAIEVPMVKPVVPCHELEITCRKQGAQDPGRFARDLFVAHVDVRVNELGRQRHGQ